MIIRAKSQTLILYTKKNDGRLDVTCRTLGCRFSTGGRNMYKLDNLFNSIFIDLITKKHDKDYKIFMATTESFRIHDTNSLSFKGRFKTLMDCEVAIRLMEGGYF